jgi:hypothetical protein
VHQEPHQTAAQRDRGQLCSSFSHLGHRQKLPSGSEPIFSRLLRVLTREQAELFSEAREGAAEATIAKSKQHAKDDEDFIALRLPKGKAVSKGKRPTGPRDGDSAAKKKSKQK